MGPMGPLTTSPPLYTPPPSGYIYVAIRGGGEGGGEV